MRFNYLLFLLFSISTLSFAQKSFTIKGVVTDSINNKGLIGANVYLKETYTGASTDAFGKFVFSEKSGNYTLVISFLGYDDKEINIKLTKDLNFNFTLSPQAILQKEIEIIGIRKSENVTGTEMGTVTLKTAEIKKLPVIFGEVDIIKTLQLMPGVQSGGEGNTGLYVRGGGPDQNLLLLDDATIYNAAHLFGFFSVFNGDAVDEVTLIKGGIPAKYGERLSSVLDISVKEGNYDSLVVKGGIGLIASRLSAECPIKKDKSSFLVSGRRTYVDIFADPYLKGKINEGSGYFFHDLNTKFTYKFSPKNKLFFSGYYGKDQFTFNNTDTKSEIKVPWSNIAASLRWNHVFNEKLTLNTSLLYSNYDFEFNISQSTVNFKLFSGIEDYKVKLDFNYYENNHIIKFGGSSIYHKFTPSNVVVTRNNTKFDTGELEILYGLENGLYIQDEFEVTKKLKAVAGVRYSNFIHLGPFTRFIKNNDVYVDTITYSTGENIYSYNGLEPRLSLRYELDSFSSIKTSYTRNYQYIHLLGLSQLSLPTDVWFPSTSIVKPQVGDLYSVGYFRNFNDDTYETSIETYYKNLDNQIEYKNGYSPQEDGKDNSDNSLVFGNGEAYGAELLIKKNKGKIKGWIGYTLSYTNRQFNDLNDGKTFYARYDRRHDLSIVGYYDLNEKWSFGATFVYASPNPITLPVGRYFMNGGIVNDYGERNNVRLLAYHRLDISATYIAKKTKKLESSWVFGIYNVYNRFNPYITNVTTSGDPLSSTFKVSATEIAIFPFLPSVTWNFKF